MAFQRDKYETNPTLRDRPKTFFYVDQDTLEIISSHEVEICPCSHRECEFCYVHICAECKLCEAREPVPDTTYPPKTPFVSREGKKMLLFCTITDEMTTSINICDQFQLRTINIRQEIDERVSTIAEKETRKKDLKSAVEQRSKELKKARKTQTKVGRDYLTPIVFVAITLTITAIIMLWEWYNSYDPKFLLIFGGAIIIVIAGTLLFELVWKKRK